MFFKYFNELLTKLPLPKFGSITVISVLSNNEDKKEQTSSVKNNGV